MDVSSLTSRIGKPLPTAMPLELRERVGFTPAHARGPDPRALGSVDNDDELCPKPVLQAPWIIGKRAFETDYCASLTACWSLGRPEYVRLT